MLAVTAAAAAGCGGTDAGPDRSAAAPEARELRPALVHGHGANKAEADCALGYVTDTAGITQLAELLGGDTDRVHQTFADAYEACGITYDDGPSFSAKDCGTGKPPPRADRLCGQLPLNGGNENPG